MSDEKDTKNQDATMEDLVTQESDRLVPFQVNEVTDVTIVSVNKGSILVDVSGVAVGVIPEREFSYGSRELKKDDTVSAFVLAQEDKDGRVVLSLRRADRERLWVTLKDKFESGDSVQAKVVEANKGGLMVEVGGVVGFLPISQLSSTHYSRNDQSRRDDLSVKLTEMVGEAITVKIINFDKITNKLIFSEKAAGDSAAEEKLGKIEIGKEIKGRITGIVDFGLFVDIGDGIEGLVHISEVSWKRVNDLRTMFHVGDEVNVQVTGVSDGKVSLSIKRLEVDPWAMAAAKFKVGDIITGTVTKLTPFGAFVKLDNTIDGLVHVSELSDEHIDDPSLILGVGDSRQFKIIAIDNASHRISLTLKGAAELTDKPAAKKRTKKTKAEASDKADSKQE